MKSLMTSVAIAALAAGIGGCASGEKSLQEKGLAPMSQMELTSEYARTRTIKWRNAAGVTGTATYKPDGTAQVEWGRGSDTGKWRIASGQFCTHWTTARNGTEYCTRIYRTGENEYESFNLDGSPSGSYSFTN